MSQNLRFCDSACDVEGKALSSYEDRQTNVWRIWQASKRIGPPILVRGPARPGTARIGRGCCAARPAGTSHRGCTTFAMRITRTKIFRVFVGISLIVIPLQSEVKRVSIETMFSNKFETCRVSTGYRNSIDFNAMSSFKKNTFVAGRAGVRRRYENVALAVHPEGVSFEKRKREALDHNPGGCTTSTVMIP